MDESHNESDKIMPKTLDTSPKKPEKGQKTGKNSTKNTAENNQKNERAERMLSPFFSQKNTFFQLFFCEEKGYPFLQKGGILI